MTLLKEYTTDFVVSKDGTKIGYRQLGKGPGVILVHGAMMSSQNFMKLAKILSKDFTVYIPDRQGRGLSDTRVKHSLFTEAEDIQALIKRTNSENIFGLSSGAIVTLQTSIFTPSLRKIALYEPPILMDGSTHIKWYSNYELALSKGKLGKAFISIIKGTGDSSLFSILPSSITAPIMAFAIKQQDKGIKNGEVPLKVLIGAFRYDYKIVIESKGILDKCGDVRAEILLLGGTRSQTYLKVVLDQLNSILSKAKRITFSGLGHLAADNGGKPKIVAKQLKSFFSSANII